MDDSTHNAYIPIHRDTGNRDGPTNLDLRAEYHKMTMSLRHNPRSAENFKELLNEILKPLVKSTGELLIQNGGEKIYFAYEGTPFTDFGVILLEVIQVHYVGCVQHYVELLVMSQDTKAKIIRVESKNIESGRWIEELGVIYIYDKRKLGRLNALIRTMAKFAPLKNEYQYSGWVLEEGNFYILDGQRLCGIDWDKDRARNSSKYVLEMLDVASHSLTIPMLSIVLLSLVHSRMVANGTFFKGVCCIVAPTQSFKTTLASLFFDLRNGVEADINFEATIAAIIRTIGNTRDATIILDDYKPGATKTESKDMLKKISTVVRMCSDSSGGVKKAGTQNSTVSNIAHGLVVVTAEQIQINVQSTLARLLVLEADRKSVNKDKLTYFQANHSEYEAFIREFIRYICVYGVEKYCKKLIQRFLKERDMLRAKLNEDMPMDNRTNDMCTWLHISFREFLRYALQIGAINEEQFGTYVEKAEKIFLSIMENQAERVAELDDVKRFFKGLQILIETNEANIEKLQPRNSSFTAPNSKSAIGFSKKGYVYLKNNVALQQVISYYHRFGREFAVGESALRKKLADSNYIVPANLKTYIHRLYINNERYQCVKFEKEKFYQLLKGGKVSGREEKREIPDNWGLQQDAESILGRGDQID